MSASVQFGLDVAVSPGSGLPVTPVLPREVQTVADDDADVSEFDMAQGDAGVYRPSVTTKTVRDAFIAIDLVSTASASDTASVSIFAIDGNATGNLAWRGTVSLARPCRFLASALRAKTAGAANRTRQYEVVLDGGTAGIKVRMALGVETT